MERKIYTELCKSILHTIIDDCIDYKINENLMINFINEAMGFCAIIANDVCCKGIYTLTYEKFDITFTVKFNEKEDSIEISDGYADNYISTYKFAKVVSNLIRKVK